ncbi:MAG: dihydroorotase [Phycisphaeraceae bacterium]|nr:dihydroorotase [Phycisphaerales bacterium]MCB9861321.1 dihydroorotase [Phycisphaeraceae bacterium]
MERVLIQNGRVIDPASGRDEICDVAVADGKIVEIGTGLSASAADTVINADGLIVAPGLIDPHVHLREPGQTHKETIETGSHAAVAGGFTTVCCMPNTSPALDSVEQIEFVSARAKAAQCRVFPVAAGTVGRKGMQSTDVAALVKAGAVAISDDGDAIASERMMLAVFEQCASSDVVFMQHCQDPAMTVGAQMHQGSVSAALGLTGWPREAEETIIDRDIALARKTNARYHVQHLSSAGSIELIRDARKEKLHVSAEASPHHLLLTHHVIDRGPDGNAFGAGPWPIAKVNPPIREATDRAAIVRAVGAGVITVLATDHAPHTMDEKDVPYEHAPMGMIGLEFALGLYGRALIASGAIDWPRLLAMMTIEPAKLCNLDRSGLGTLQEGGIPDITIIDPSAEWKPSRDDCKGKSWNTPFIEPSLGISCLGRAVLTMVGGEIRHRMIP